MRVSHLSLTNFRNYETAEFSFEPGANLLVGRNGQGKTNVVEAMGYFASLRSHRVTGDAALVRAGEESAIVRMKVESADRSVQLELQINRERQNRAQVNRNAVRPRELMRWFSSVLFAPEDLTIVRGEPSGRRRFLDEALVARFPVAAGALADYERVLRQRTSLLKSTRASGSRKSLDATIDVWDAQLVEFGSQIILARRELLQDLLPKLGEGYRHLVAADHGPGLAMHESVFSTLSTVDVSRGTFLVGADESVSRETIEESFRDALQKVRSREIERAVTLVGPHRDDMMLTLNDLPVKGYASHGESWSFALALKLALAQVLRAESSAGDPVIVLDDVFAELDASRRGRLMSAVSDFEQVIVTAAVEGDVGGDISWNRTRIESGRIVLGER